MYGGPFVDEVRSRLRFNPRGLAACANAGTANINNRQFFLALNRCDWLNKKNMIFGKITGDTVYNLMKLGELETDKNDRPLNPPNVVSVEK
jgi:peptidyl-prolyl cis-trans isomerase SDCCAG10